MVTVKQHYADVLTEIYSWMLGGFDRALEKNTEFFKKHNITPEKSKVAIDFLN